ncbi:MAG: excisionase [Oscillospiraceae bacterium]|jgi:hypothetical protein|nr:excisionase [Oscillospiraceae bacterium]
MNYTLMHKNVEVVDIRIDESAVAITNIGTVHSPEHIPLGVQSLKGGIDREELNDWLRSRSIPASRSGIRELYTRLGRSSTEHLILKCHALSLSDHYWVCPKNSGLLWAEINFFQNDFSKDVGEILFGHEPADRNKINLMSPDNTSVGWLKKRWIIVDGKRALIKGGNDPWKQEPYNEVIASEIMRRLGIVHVPYSLIFDGGESLSLCENFLSADTEFIPAWNVFYAKKMNDIDSDFSHLLRCCDTLGIPNTRTAIDKMLTLDCIIANEDRHYNNFGFIRNADTLEWLGFAPIFDCGTSLWHNVLDIGAQRKSQPFQETHEEQIKLVADLSWFNIEALEGIEQEISAIFSQSPLVDENRSNAISKAVLDRAKMLEQ